MFKVNKKDRKKWRSYTYRFFAQLRLEWVRLQSL